MNGPARPEFLRTRLAAIATAYEALGDAGKAREFYTQSAGQKGGRSEIRFYQGLSYLKLGQKSKADEIFDELIATGRQRLSEKPMEDVFAKFGEGQTPEAHQASAHYMLALGYRGKGQTDQAKAELEAAVKLDASHLWARAQLAELE